MSSNTTYHHCFPLPRQNRRRMPWVPTGDFYCFLIYLCEKCENGAVHLQMVCQEAMSSHIVRRMYDITRRICTRRDALHWFSAELHCAMTVLKVMPQHKVSSQHHDVTSLHFGLCFQCSAHWDWGTYMDSLRSQTEVKDAIIRRNSNNAKSNLQEKANSIHQSYCKVDDATLVLHIALCQTICRPRQRPPEPSPSQPEISYFTVQNLEGFMGVLCAEVAQNRCLTTWVSAEIRRKASNFDG